MKIWQAIAALALLICLTSGGGAEEEEEEHIVHFHPITPEEYEAILGLTNGSPVISEARLIASGLAAIKSLAAGIKTGFAAAWWLPTLLSSFGYTQKEKDNNTDKVRDGYPLCVIRPGYFAEDNDETAPKSRRNSHSRRGGGRKPLPLAHCIVVVKQKEENGGSVMLQTANPWSYPPPYPQPRPIVTEKPTPPPADPASYPYNPYYPYYSYPSYKPKYPGYPQYSGYPGYYANYPGSSAPVPAAPAAPAPPTEEEPAEEEPTEEATEAPPPPQIIEHKKRVHHSIHKHLHHRSAPRPAYDWPLASDYTHSKPRSKKKKRDEVATYSHPQNYAQISNYPGSGYETAYYPQYNYQSNYPKVSYTHALPYPAPVYRQMTAPKPAKKKIANFDSEEAENSAEYIKVRSN